MEISWRHAEEHAKTAIMLGRRCKPPEAALEASPLTTMGDIASAMCRFPVAKERCMPVPLLRCAAQAFFIFFGLFITGTGRTLYARFAGLRGASGMFALRDVTYLGCDIFEIH